MELRFNPFAQLETTLFDEIVAQRGDRQEYDGEKDYSFRD